MREIKFRVRWKRKDGEIFTQIFDWADLVAGTMQYCDGEIISRDQYTDRHDKNGKEVFGGDVVRDKINGITREVFWDDNALCWSTKTIQTKQKFHEYLCRLNIYRNEVIGNIYENPELLGKKAVEE